MSVAGGVANRNDPAVRQAQLGRPLHMRDVHFKRVAQPDQFLSLEHVRAFERRPIGIRRDLPARIAAAQRLAVGALHQVLGHLVEGVLKASGPLERGVEDRRIVPGEQHGPLVVATDGHVDVEMSTNHAVELGRPDARIHKSQKRLQRLDHPVVVDIAVGVVLLA